MLTILLSLPALAVPMQLTHTGRLLDGGGVPVSGTQVVEVDLYSDPTGGASLWSETLDVDFDDGFFSTLLGTDTVNNPIGAAQLDHATLFVELTVSGTVTSRQRVVSVPYAMVADTAVNVSGGVVDASEIRVGGNVVIDASGAVAPGADSDTLAELTCLADEVPLFNGTDWTCAAASSTGGVVTWGDLSGVPSGFDDDVDNDLLGSMTCSSNQVARWDGIAGQWACAAVDYADLVNTPSFGVVATSNDFDDLDNIPAGLADGDDDTQLDEAAVDLFVANNGYAADADISTVGKSNDFADLDNIPAGLSDGDDDTQLDEAAVDAFVSNNGYAMDADIAVVGKTGAFSDLTGIPAGLSDGDDDTQLDEAAVDGFVANNGYAMDADISTIGKSGLWSDIQSIPGDFADGVDDVLSEAAVETMITNGPITLADGSSIAGGLDVTSLTLGDDGSTCGGGNAGEVKFDGTDFLGCDGSKWRRLEMNDPRPVLVESADTYTYAEIRAFQGSWPAQGGEGNICPNDYHVCTWMEAMSHKYSGKPITVQGDQYLIAYGNYSYVGTAGISHPHNSIVGYNDGGGWGGTTAACGNGRAGLLYFYSDTNLERAIEWDGGCHTDNVERRVACCLHRSQHR